MIATANSPAESAQSDLDRADASADAFAGLCRITRRLHAIGRMARNAEGEDLGWYNGDLLAVAHDGYGELEELRALADASLGPAEEAANLVADLLPGIIACVSAAHACCPPTEIPDDEFREAALFLIEVLHEKVTALRESEREQDRARRQAPRIETQGTLTVA